MFSDLHRLSFYDGNVKGEPSRENKMIAEVLLSRQKTIEKRHTGNPGYKSCQMLIVHNNSNFECSKIAM